MAKHTGQGEKSKMWVDPCPRPHTHTCALCGKSWPHDMSICDEPAVLAACCECRFSCNGLAFTGTPYTNKWEKVGS